MDVQLPELDRSDGRAREAPGGDRERELVAALAATTPRSTGGSA